MAQQYEIVPADRVLTLEEAIAFKQRSSVTDVKVWRWSGNALNDGEAAHLANVPPEQAEGEVMFNVNPNGTVAMWLFY